MLDHLEVVIPPTDDVETAVADAMATFHVTNDRCTDRFWESYVIGGRWSSVKLESMLEASRFQSFMDDLDRYPVEADVSPGELPKIVRPRDRRKVDRVWRKWFPTLSVDVCPYFQHFQARYSGRAVWPNVVKVGELGPVLRASRTLIVVPTSIGDLNATGPVVFALFIAGVTGGRDAPWDGDVNRAIREHGEMCRASDGAGKFDLVAPVDDWLVVTVDYSSVS